MSFFQLFVDFLKSLKYEIEKFLLGNASKAVLSKNWEALDQKVRKKICATSFVGYDKTNAKVKPKVTGKNAPKPVESNSSRSARAHSNKETRDSQQQLHHHNTTTVAPTKVASVRPMQVQSQQKSHKLELEELTKEITVVKPVKSPTTKQTTRTNMRLLNSESPEISSNTTAPIQVNSNTVTRPNRNKKSLPLEQKERSFTGSTVASRNASSNSASAVRTPVKPLTPVTPSKPSPILGQHQRATSAPKYRIRSAKTSLSEPVEDVKKTPNKVFMSNSARAAAVSKPLLKCTVKPSGVTSKVSCGLNKDGNATQKSGERRNSNASNPSMSGRSSFSNVEKPSPPSARVRNNPSGHSRKNSSGGQQNCASSNNSTVSTTTTITARSNTTSGNRSTINAKREVNSAKNSYRENANATTATKVVKGSYIRRQHIDLMDDSNNISDDDGLRVGSPFKSGNSGSMSRSTIETDMGEPRVRTLAEIGRSSTFSKDEPTVLGRMDGSAYDTLEDL